LENAGGFCRSLDWPGSLAETAKFEEANCENGEAQGGSGKNEDAKKWRERLKARKMPMRSDGSG